MSNKSPADRMHKGTKADKQESRLETLSYLVSSGIGKFFYNLGYIVANNPRRTICFALLSVIMCSIGFLNFHQERDPLKLWVPEHSDFLQHTEFIIKNFGEAVRTQSVMIVSDSDVLTPRVLHTLALIDKEVKDIRVIGEDGKLTSFEEICFKIPLIGAFTVTDEEDQMRKRRKRSRSHNEIPDGEEDDSKKALNKLLEPLMNFDMKNYCGMIEALPKGCMRENFLELWKTHRERIQNLSKEDIISKLNRTEYSPETGHAANFVSMLGEVARDGDGKIISAKSLISSWMLQINFSEVNSAKLGNNAGTENWATYNTLVFEEKFLEIMQRLKEDLETDDLKIYYSAGRSYGDISSKTMFQDMDKVFMGVGLMMIYMILVLSKFSWTELRFTLALVGLANVGMAYVSGCGISSSLFSYSPVHTSLFFIIMGLGVDDIFVINSALRKVKNDYKDLTLPVQMGKAMEKAGASITITSLTDIIAFLVGGTTVLPSLKSFCIFAAMCILMTYLYVVTFFVACLTIDEKRVSKNRNCCCPCVVHNEANVWWEPKLMPRFITFLYSKVVLTKPGKVFVILAAIALSGFSAEKVFHIKQKFDPIWFIPSSTQYFQYVMTHRHYYPDRGFEAAVYLGTMNYTAELPKIIRAAELIKNQTSILSHVQAWTEPFQEYIQDSYNTDIKETPLSDIQFKTYLSKFLFSSYGGAFQANFKFQKQLTCGTPTEEVKISSISFNYHKFEDRDEYLPAKKAVEKIINEANFNSDHAFVWGEVFGNWLTDEIIDAEIFRNISLALIGVFICTSIMIVNVQVCAFIFVCVLLSLVSVGGFMQLWGLGLDLVTCISLQLSVGLCIDCAAHIGHTFLTISEGDGNQRALKTVEQIGAAVWQGGGSTMLAVALLGFSDAYTYQTFFKVFTIVILFGLFYGTFLLPVILSIFTPKPYDIRSQHDQLNKGTELSVIDTEESEFIKKHDNINSTCDNGEAEKLNGLK